MKKGHDFIRKVEEYFCAALLCTIVALSFITAIGRCINHPVSWTIEVSQLLLAWLAFIGADMAFRSDKIMGVDILTRKLPARLQVLIRLIMNILILGLLYIFVRYGYALCMSNLKRSFQTVGVSYAWATASLPVASVLMIISAILKIISCVRTLIGKNTGKEEDGV